MNLETLQKFCHTYSATYATPFNNRGCTYATCGAILLKLEGCKADRDLDSETFQEGQIDSQFEGPFGSPFPLSTFLTEEQTEPCSVCKGTGKLTECPECEGSGEIELDSGYNFYSVECQTCDGEGHLSDAEGAEDCDNCDGTGEVSVRTPVLIDSQSFDNRLINKLVQNLPKEATISPSSNPGRAALLSWEGGTGLIMPLRT